MEQKTIQSVVRTLNILDCFSEQKFELSITELYVSLGLNKSTVFGLVKTLEQCGYLVQNVENKKYRLGAKLISRGICAAASLNICQIAAPWLEALNRKYNEACNLFLYEGGALHCVLSFKSEKNFLSMKTEIGTELPLGSSASGKAVLAALDDEEMEEWMRRHDLRVYTSHSIVDKEALIQVLHQIRREGYASELEEMEPGVDSLAVAVRDLSGVRGTISVTGPSVRIRSIRDEIVPEMKKDAAQISEALGFCGEWKNVR